MKRYALLVVFASLAMALAGCSKHSEAGGVRKNNNLGVIDVSSGKPSSYTLADGRTCTIAPTLVGGYVRLTITIAGANSSNKAQVFTVPADGHPETFSIDKSTDITVAPLLAPRR